MIYCMLRMINLPICIGVYSYVYSIFRTYKMLNIFNIEMYLHAKGNKITAVR